MKKRFLGFFCLVFLVIGLTGCQFMRAEEQALSEATVHEMEMAMMGFLPKHSQLISPASPKRTQPVFKKDVDGDGIAEGIAFFRTEKKDQIGFIVIQRDQKLQWHVRNKMLMTTSSLVYGDVVDVTKDGIAELIIATDEQAVGKRLTIYELGKNKQYTLLQRPYEQKVIYDFEKDGSSEVVLFTTQRDQQKKKAETVAELYDYRGDFVMSHRLVLEGETKEGNLRAGKVNDKKHGIFLNLHIGLRGGSVTELLYPTKGLLQRAFDMKQEVYQFRWVNEPSRDINGDGVTEFPMLEKPEGTAQLNTEQTPFVCQWFQWTTEDKKRLVAEQYEDLQAGYYLEYPEKWIGNVTATVQGNRVTFFDSQRLPLVTLKHYKHAEWNQLTSEQRNMLKKIRQDGQWVYVVELPQENNSKTESNFILTVEELKKQFHVLAQTEKKRKLSWRKIVSDE